MARSPSASRVLFLVVVAALLAALANFAAPSRRKLAWVGEYPRALDVGPPTESGNGKRETGTRESPTTPPGARNAEPVQKAPAQTAVDGGSPLASGRSPLASGGSPLATPSGGAAMPPPAAAPAAAAVDSGKTFPPHPDKPAVEISPGDVEVLYRRKALFLDARRSEVYAEAHIAGARSFPVWEADVADRVKALYEEGLDQQAPIVVYCSGGNCEDSHMLAEKLYMVGFDNVLIYKEGFPDWQKRSLPVSKGASP